MNQIRSFAHFTDAALVAEVTRLASSERHATASVVASLAELDRRRLHLAYGFSSLFDYCVSVLKLSEHETYNRIEAARAVRRFPTLLDRLIAGDLSLTAVRLLAPHLTEANCEHLVSEAKGLGKEGIKLLIARLHPQPPVPSVVRKLPERAPSPALPGRGEPPMSLSDLVAPPSPSHRPIVAPLSEAHYKLQVTISAAARERLRAIQDLMRHRIPNGDPAAIVEHALDVLHAELLKKKAAEVARPRAPRSDDAAGVKGRCIPASVRRAVFRRDEGRCAFVSEDGRKCGSASGVEFHHVRPYAAGGDATEANLQLRCRAHNVFEWTQHLDDETAALLR